MELQQINEKLTVNISLSQQIELQTLETMPRPKNRILRISNQNEVYFLHPETILYVEADGNYCNIHLTDGDILNSVGFQRSEVAKKMGDQLEKDILSKFVLVGRSFLVNIEHILVLNTPQQKLIFDVNDLETKRKKRIGPSVDALRKLRSYLDANGTYLPAPQEVTANVPAAGFVNHMVQKAKVEPNYDIEDDDILPLG